jgi:hypothetical protein
MLVFQDIMLVRLLMILGCACVFSKRATRHAQLTPAVTDDIKPASSSFEDANV